MIERHEEIKRPTARETERGAIGGSVRQIDRYRVRERDSWRCGGVRTISSYTTYEDPLTAVK